MTLKKTSFLNGIAVFARVGTSLVLNKIMAMFIGPSGYAFLGQFQNVLAIIVNFAGGAVSSGVTKLTAQHYDDEPKQHAVWKTAIRFSLITSFIVGTSIFFFSSHLSQWIFHNTAMTNIFIWLAVSLPAMAINNVLMAIVNGKKEVGIFFVSNISGSIFSLLISGTLIFFYGLKEANPFLHPIL